MTDPEDVSALDNPPELDAKTLGEHVADAEARAGEQEVDDHLNKTDTHDSEVAVTAEPNALLPTLRELVAQYEDLDKEWQRLKRQAKDTKADRDEVFEQIKSLAGTKTPQEMHDLPVMQAARGEAPLLHPPVDTCDFYEMGRVAARAGTPESCYDTHSADANEQHRWLRGWRFETAALKEAKEAQVQALFLDQLRDALMPHPGFLPLGEEQPKVKHWTVTWNDRPHLVVDCINVNGGARDEWQLQPLFDRDEWALLHEPTYGPAIAGVDASDDEKATRTRGGQDCGRLVKVGRSVYVVGPRSGLVTVYTDSANQPSH